VFSSYLNFVSNGSYLCFCLQTKNVGFAIFRSTISVSGLMAPCTDEHLEVKESEIALLDIITDAFRLQTLVVYSQIFDQINAHPNNENP
jgi:hypothetical protein